MTMYTQDGGSCKSSTIWLTFSSFEQRSHDPELSIVRVGIAARLYLPISCCYFMPIKPVSMSGAG